MAGSQPEPAGVVGVQATAVVVGTMAAAAVGWAHRREPLLALTLVAWVAVATWLSVIDLRERRLPNRIVGPLAVAVTVGLLGSGILTGNLDRSGRAMAVGAIAFLIGLAANLAGGVGMGDVKYAFPLFATVGWFGSDAVLATLLATTFSGALAGMVVLARGLGRRYRLPYGPFMSLGLVAGLLSATPA